MPSKCVTATTCIKCYRELSMFLIDNHTWIGECLPCRLAYTWWPPNHPIRGTVTPLINEPEAKPPPY
jgi:hypothetical protein